MDKYNPKIDPHTRLSSYIRPNPKTRLAELIIMQCLNLNATDLYFKIEKEEPTMEYAIYNERHEMKAPPKIIARGTMSELESLFDIKNNNLVASLKHKDREIDIELIEPTSHEEAPHNLHIRFSYNR